MTACLKAAAESTTNGIEDTALSIDTAQNSGGSVEGRARHYCGRRDGHTTVDGGADRAVGKSYSHSTEPSAAAASPEEVTAFAARFLRPTQVECAQLGAPIAEAPTPRKRPECRSTPLRDWSGRESTPAKPRPGTPPKGGRASASMAGVRGWGYDAVVVRRVDSAATGSTACAGRWWDSRGGGPRRSQRRGRRTGHRHPPPGAALSLGRDWEGAPRRRRP